MMPVFLLPIFGITLPQKSKLIYFARQGLLTPLFAVLWSPDRYSVSTLFQYFVSYLTKY